MSGTISGAGTLQAAATVTFAAGASLAVADVLQTGNVALSAGVSLTNAGSYLLAVAAGKSATLSGTGASLFTNSGVLSGSGPGTANISTAFSNTARFRPMAARSPLLAR